MDPSPREGPITRLLIHVMVYWTGRTPTLRKARAPEGVSLPSPGEETEVVYGLWALIAYLYV